MIRSAVQGVLDTSTGSSRLTSPSSSSSLNHRSNSRTAAAGAMQQHNDDNDGGSREHMLTVASGAEEPFDPRSSFQSSTGSIHEEHIGGFSASPADNLNHRGSRNNNNNSNNARSSGSGSHQPQLNRRSSAPSAFHGSNGSSHSFATSAGPGPGPRRRQGSFSKGRRQLGYGNGNFCGGNGGSSSSSSATVLMMFAALISMAAGYKLFDQYMVRREDAVRTDVRQKEVAAVQKELNAKLQQQQYDNNSLRQQLSDAEGDSKTLKQQVQQLMMKMQDHDVEHLKEELDYLQNYKEKMHHSMQSLAKQRLLEVFGPGPHRVEVTVAFDPESNVAMTGSDSDEGKLILELAPVEKMPYTVYWFLEQVDRKLFDGCSFHRHAGHVLQAGPTTNFLSEASTTAEALHKQFRDAGFYTVLFQEYSEDYPHKEYTVGYGGRPGGPDFYINLEDNVRAHGPGGQHHHHNSAEGHADEADPCFAKVVGGYDVLHRMKESDVEPGGYHSLRHSVAIVSMKILTKNPQPVVVVA